MKLRTNHRNYKLFWRHLDINESQNEKLTWCIIENTASGVQHVGEAICSSKDNYNKEVGRKTSLTRALKEAGFSKKSRRDFWNFYIGRKTNGQAQGDVQRA